MLFLQHFQQAFQAYQAQAKRPGYTFGLFSWFRHSATLYPHIQALQDNLTKAKDNDEAKRILGDYFSDPKTTYNNHSFATYLLDVLMKNDPKNTDNWEQFLPPQKRQIFYSGKLYRGMKIDNETLQGFFTQGLSALEDSDKIEDYVNTASYTVGISTSKERLIAQWYARIDMVTWGDGARHIRIPGYLLELDYTGCGGIDILETYKLRGEILNQKLAADKHEVNIIGSIPAQNIKGAYFIDPCGEKRVGDFIANPNYKPNYRKTPTAQNLATRRQHLFSSAPALPLFAPNKVKPKPKPPAPPVPVFTPNRVRFKPGV